jgi:hypothetical protein
MQRLSLNVLAVMALLASVCPPDAAAQAKAGGSPESSAAAVAAAARLPEGANAVLTLDVAKLIASPWGKQVKLQDQLSAGHADRPLPVSAAAKRLTVGALVHPMSMDALWQAAVVESAGAPRLDPILRAQGGYLDQIGGKEAAWSPRDAFYVALDDHTLGVVRPAQRQVVSHWVSAKAGKGVSPYVASALAAAGNADGVFAIDLEDVVGATALHYAVDMGQMPSLNSLETVLDKLLVAVASVKGMTITMRAGNTLEGQCVVDFGQDVSALGAETKPFITDVMTMAGFYEPDMDQWNFKAEGKRIVGKRAINEEGLKRLLGVLSPPNVGAVLQADEDGFGGPAPKPAAAQAGPAKSPATASQEYYRAISKKLDTIGTKPSPTQTAGALTAHAREIEQLPILNVDPELVKWGGAVADAFLRGAQELALGQQKAKVAAQGVASPVAYTTYTYNGSTGNTTREARAAYRNAQQQRQAASQTQRNAAATQAFAVLNDVLPTRAKVRAEMTQKYGVEF